MNTYTISEKQDLNSSRDGSILELSSLTAAKRYASKNQCFFGTVLTIEQNGSLVSYKESASKWVNV